MAESMIKRLMKLRLKNNAEDVLYKNQSFYENLSDEDLASGTEIAFRGLASGLKNEETDFTEMFCPRSLDLEKKIRKQWKMLSRNDKNFFGKIIFEDCEIFVQKFLARGGQLYFNAFIWSKMSEVPERFEDFSVKVPLLPSSPKFTQLGMFGYQYIFDATFRYDEETEQWLLQSVRGWPINEHFEEFCQKK